MNPITSANFSKNYTHNNVDTPQGYVDPSNRGLKRNDSSLYKLYETQSVDITETDSTKNLLLGAIVQLSNNMKKPAQNSIETKSCTEPTKEFKNLRLIWKFKKVIKDYALANNYGFFTSLGQPIAAFFKENSFCLYDVDTKLELNDFQKVHKYPIVFLKATPNGNFFATCDVKNNLLIWSTKSLKIKFAFRCSSKSKTVSNIEFNKNETLLAVGSRNSFSVWDFQKQKKLHVFKDCHIGNVSNLAFTDDSIHIISATNSTTDRTVKIFNLVSKQLIKKLDITNKSKGIYGKEIYQNIELMKISPKNQFLLTVSHRHNVLHDLAACCNHEIVESFVYENQISQAEFCPDNRNIIVGVNSSLEIIEILTGNLVKRLNLIHSGDITVIKFDQTGQFIISCCKGKTYFVHEYREKPITKKVEYPNNTLGDLKVKVEKKPEILNMELIDTFEAVLPEYRNSKNIIDFSNNDKCIIVWVKGKKFLLQDMKTKLVIESFDNIGDGTIKDLQFSKNGLYFVTIDTKNNIICYDIHTHHVVQRYTWPADDEKYSKNTQNLFSVAWAPDDSHFAVGGLNSIRVFHISGKLDWIIASENDKDEGLFENQEIYNVCFSNDGFLLAASC